MVEYLLENIRIMPSPNKKRIPIQRMGKFFDENDFKLEVGMGREWVEGDLNMTVVLFQVDRTKSKVDEVYGESSPTEIKFKKPVELNVRYQLEVGENKSYSGGYLHLKDFGPLTFQVYVEHLEELGVEIIYGDYVGISLTEDVIKYFTVVDDGGVNFDNVHTIAGYKGYYRTIKATPADANEFNPQY